jgi:hypothetical protein
VKETMKEKWRRKREKITGRERERIRLTNQERERERERKEEYNRIIGQDFSQGIAVRESGRGGNEKGERGIRYFQTLSYA